MSEPPAEIEETQPTAPQDTSPVNVVPEQPPARKKRGPWIRLLLLGWLILLAAGAIGGYSGYQQGREDWLVTRAALDEAEIEAQYQLGLARIAEGECERAQIHLDYVIENDPNHEGAIEAMAQAITCQIATVTPTPVTPTPTPTITPTPDLRRVDEQFAEAEALMAAGEWDSAIARLFSVRRNDPTFRPVDVDSMLYVAYRNRGVDKILNQAMLESGMFDLAQAELFGPLDTEARSYRDWARFYLIGLTFYSVQDWGQAQFYFGQFAPVAPNLRDGTSGFAMNLYLESLEKYINQLVEAKDWCLAAEMVGLYRNFVEDPTLQNQQDRYQERCDDDD